MDAFENMNVGGEMNRLSKLSIDGYKSIRHMEMEFMDINILIGGNGAGKSNLLSFFDMLQRIRKYELQGYVTEQGGVNALLYNGRKQTDACNFWVERKEFRFYGRIKARSADGCYFEQQGLYDYVNQANCYVADGFPELKDEGSVERTGVLGDIGLYHFHDTSVSSPMKVSCSIYDNIELASDGRNIAAILYRIKLTAPESYRYIVQMVRLAAPYFKDFVLRVNPLNQQTIQLEWIKEGSDILFNAEQLSDGTLRFICLATLLCQPDEMRKDVICIDEPELGLHPYAITVLTELIKKYSGERQVIAATQSVGFINAFGPQDIIVVDSKGGESCFNRLDVEGLQDWLEDYSLGEIWEKNVIGGRP